MQSTSTATTGQVFKYDSEKPAFARKGALMASESSSPTISLTDQYPDIVEYLAALETAERIKFYPHLRERAPNIEIDVEQLSNDTANDNNKEDNRDSRETSTIASLRHEGIKDFSLQLLTNIEPSTYTNIITLDVSHNELSDLPGIASLSNLEVLCIKRNWFNTLPTDIGKLHKLKKIDASRNFMKPNIDSLRLNELKNLSQLQLLDVTLNQKCRTADHRKFIKQYLQPLDVEVLVTVWQEASNGEHNCIGASAAQRNAVLLRSQLEPWGTVNLRRRLVMDFGQDAADQVRVDENGAKKLVDRGTIMEMLLSCYQKEGLLQFDNDSDSEDLNLGIGQRKVIRVDGVPVREELLTEILEELKDWRHNGKRGGSSNNRERPSIKAECYMILRAPPLEEETSSEAKGTYASRREKRRHKKMEGNKKLWNLALQAMKETDPEFATRCSEIAVTYGFTGSPHIDRQNSSPFYGLSLGNFTEYTGCVAVECSPRIMAHVNTKNRLGRVDGRHPHFVTPYDDQNEERFSLIYYDTLGAFEAPGPAIFTKSLDS